MPTSCHMVQQWFWRLCSCVLHSHTTVCGGSMHVLQTTTFSPESSPAGCLMNCNEWQPRRLAIHQTCRRFLTIVDHKYCTRIGWATRVLAHAYCTGVWQPRLYLSATWTDILPDHNWAGACVRLGDGIDIFWTYLRVCKPTSSCYLLI